MKTLQQRTLEKIEDVVGRYGCECTLSANYSNTGQVNIHKPGNPMACASITYDFQPSTHTLSLTAGHTKIPSQPGREGYYDFYQDNVGDTRFWQALDDMMVKYLGQKLQSKPQVPRVVTKQKS